MPDLFWISSLHLYKVSLQNVHLPAVNQTQWMAAEKEFKTWQTFTLNMKCAKTESTCLLSKCITKHSNKHCIITQQHAMSHCTVRSSNNFDLLWSVNVQTHSDKAVCTNYGIWLSLDNATTALSRMLAMFKLAYIYFNFTNFCTVYKPQIYSYFIPTDCVTCDDLDLHSLGA
jgi:hypothetical protein